MKRVAISGIGVSTCAMGSVRALGLDCPSMNEGILSRLESPATWAVAAVHQAWHMAGLDALNHERIGLLYCSVWGSVTATVDYLESLFEAEGRFTSPRHFSRSTYASPASALGIQFQIHGPCETLSFDRFPVCGALDHARLLMAGGRCDAVVVCWADDSAPIVGELTQLAVKKLCRKEFERFTVEPPGAGAVAMVVRESPTAALNITCQWTDEVHKNQQPFSHPPYPTDAAISLAAAIAQIAKEGSITDLWTEPGPHKTSTSLRLSRGSIDK